MMRWLSDQRLAIQRLAIQRLAIAQAFVLCLPYPGLGANMYRRWPVARDGVYFCPVELPSREIHAAAHLPALALALTKELAPYRNRPFAIFGHGEAALIGYEAAAWMCAAGLPAPRRLYVSAQAPPHHGPHDRLARLSGRERTEQIRTMLYRIHGDCTQEALTACLSTLDADLAMLARYRPIEAMELACPVVAIGWSHDRQVDRAAMRGWVECGRTTYVVLDGDHAAGAEPPAPLLDLLASDLTPGPVTEGSVDCGG